MTNVRKHIELLGILQGIGCRPTLSRLASKLKLAGWVINTSDAVTLEIEGSEESCRNFLDELPGIIPAPGRIDQMTVSATDPIGEKTFQIRNSSHGKRGHTPIPPDVSVCPECVNELFDPDNRRFLYPFITCTVCGPRFTVVRSFPYDRERTSMADFTMCQECMEEYETPLDRRFHSQTNSCPACGPKLIIVDPDGNPIPGEPITRAVKMLKQGKIIAIKGIGGFHLACDALDSKAVQLLRDRKGRAEKPFAVMMNNVDTVRYYCVVSELEESVLTSMASPIVLLRSTGKKLAKGVAPGMSNFGVMLPYTPIHHLLFKHPLLNEDTLPLALVMTSGNRSEEPICKDNDEALRRLRDLVDAFVIHDREIVLRADDSIVRAISEKAVVFRRSRGYVPGAFPLKRVLGRSGKLSGADEEQDSDNAGAKSFVGTGGDLKNAPAILKGNLIVPGPHVGDLASPIAQDYFESSVDVLADYLEVKPDFMAFDPHPEYFSHHLARRSGLKSFSVYHHHAHAVSLLVEKDINSPTLFAVFDGTGYGTDGSVWGGEFMVADRSSFERLGRFSLFPLIGGESAIREPARILAGLLWLANGYKLTDRVRNILGPDALKADLWIETLIKGINSPLTSSVGRLFDAAAVLAGFRKQVTFESQASMWFEGVAHPEENGKYETQIVDNGLIEVDSGALIGSMSEDALSGTSPSVMSARFHNSLSSIVSEVLEILAKRTGIETVGLTGGCFQNRLLTEKSVEYLRRKGLNPMSHESIPPNDGGIAIGQVACAFERLYCGPEKRRDS